MLFNLLPTMVLKVNFKLVNMSNIVKKYLRVINVIRSLHCDLKFKSEVVKI